MDWLDLDKLMLARARQPEVPFFSPEEAFWICCQQEERKVSLIDVRREDEIVQAGFFPGSISIVWGHSESDFAEKLACHVPSFDRFLLFYCRSGRRSASAVRCARLEGYTNAYNVDGGFLAVSACFPNWVERTVDG